MILIGFLSTMPLYTFQPFHLRIPKHLREMGHTEFSMVLYWSKDVDWCPVYPAAALISSGNPVKYFSHAKPMLANWMQATPDTGILILFIIQAK